MPYALIRPALLAIVLVAGTPAVAPALTQLEAGVAQQLPSYGFRDIDVEGLSTAQLASLHHILNASSLSQSEKRRQIRSVLGGPYSLRDLFR